MSCFSCQIEFHFTCFFYNNSRANKVRNGVKKHTDCHKKDRELKDIPLNQMFNKGRMVVTGRSLSHNKPDKDIVLSFDNQTSVSTC